MLDTGGGGGKKGEVQIEQVRVHVPVASGGYGNKLAVGKVVLDAEGLLVLVDLGVFVHVGCPGVEICLVAQDDGLGAEFVGSEGKGEGRSRSRSSIPVEGEPAVPALGIIVAAGGVIEKTVTERVLCAY